MNDLMPLIRHPSAFLLARLSLLLTPLAAAAAEPNWPQWRGPLANGLAPDAHPPVTWSESSHIKWKVPLPGNGASTPIIWGDKIFIQTAINTGNKAEGASSASAPPAGGGRGMSGPPLSELLQFTLLCLDRKTGRTLWQKVAREEVPHEGVHPDHGFSSYSPVTDGNNVFALFGSHGLHCYDTGGNLRWQKDLGRMQIKLGFGEGSSPALFGNTLVVNWDHEGEDFIAAFDKETGQQLWRQPREEDTSWSTPFIVWHDKGTEVVVSATRKVRSYDLATGKPLWEISGLGPNAIPSPVSGHGMIYVTTGYQRFKLFAIKLGRTGVLTGTDAVAWSLDRNTPYVASPLLYGDLLYLFKERNGVLSCYDAKTGNPHFTEQRLEAFSDIYASPVGAAGRVYFVGRNGTALVIKHSEKLEILATNKLDDGFEASPALVGNELFLRGRKNLYCIAEQ